jgi:NADH-quinone oxidoreductase subunit H
VFKAAPMLMLMSAFGAGHHPVRPHAHRARPRRRHLLRPRRQSFAAIGVLMAGWSSANKYSLIGGLRAGAQLIAYELPLILAVVGVVIHAGTMSMGGIVAAQSETGVPHRRLRHRPALRVPGPHHRIRHLHGGRPRRTQPHAVRPADRRAGAGDGIPHRVLGLRFTMFFLAEYAGMFSLSAIAATLFLGGYYVPGDPGGNARLRRARWSCWARRRCWCSS